MKKIMFNDKYGLTEAVLQGRKTMTRMAIAAKDEIDAMVYARGSVEKKMEYLLCKSKYKIGEVVAVAQSYKDLGYTEKWVEQHISPNPNANWNDPFKKKYPGWNNKMFVPSELNNAHKICITDIKVERLKDISSEDAFREGITVYCSAPRAAFAYLIDKVCGKGTWESNPWVFAYTFELEK